MKTLTCRDLGGACDAPIAGNTPAEMGENCKKHAMQMMQANDTAHIEAMKKMANMTPEQFQEFMVEFQKKFEAA